MNPISSTAGTTPGHDHQAWLDEYHQTKARLQAGTGAGVARLDQLAGLTGLQTMQAMLAGQMPYPHIADTMDFIMVGVAAGRAEFMAIPQHKHLNPLGTVHGGWYATLLDSALGCAVHTSLPAGLGYTTAELSVNLVRSANPRDGVPLRAVGQVIHSGRQLATAEARIVGPDGKLYAHGTTTCLVFEARPRA
jgi:uncharacterized protein (TIGR00369 family)